jgi:hypothetical protein
VIFVSKHDPGDGSTAPWPTTRPRRGRQRDHAVFERSVDVRFRHEVRERAAVEPVAE